MECALVTGGSRGIGRAICLELGIVYNYHVLVNYAQNSTMADETVSKIIEAGGSAEKIQFKVEDAEAVSVAIDNWELQNPDKYIAVLVNNAGIIAPNLFVFMEEKDWHQVIDVKLNGFFHTTRHLLSKMALKRKGRVVNIASTFGINGSHGQANYAAANGAILAATKSLAQEVGRRNVTVNAVAPGYIKTDMTHDLNHENAVKNIPAGRLGTPEEVAGIVGFLTTDKAAYINGAVITVNGGLPV